MDLSTNLRIPNHYSHTESCLFSVQPKTSEARNGVLLEGNNSIANSSGIQENDSQIKNDLEESQADLSNNSSMSSENVIKSGSIINPLPLETYEFSAPVLTETYCEICKRHFCNKVTFVTYLYFRSLILIDNITII